MAMKMLVLVTMVTLLKQGTVEGCYSRADKAIWNELQETISCSEPQEALVPLPVPAGYDFVRPDFVKLKQCSGLSCQFYLDKCHPAGSITKTYNVMAYKGEIPYCVNVKVEEHSACKCSCDRIQCPNNKKFSKYTCSCECIKQREEECLVRRNNEQPVMWSKDTCSCHCDNVRPCGYGMSWDSDSCRCVYRHPNDV